MTMVFEPFGSLFEAPHQWLWPAGHPRTFFPPADLLAGEEEVTLEMDVPGLKSEDLEIELSEGMLRISGERRYPYAVEQSQRSIHRLERGYGRFERLLHVPEDVDPIALSASIEDGVLTVGIPAPEGRKAHRIEIRGAEDRRVVDAEWSTEGDDQDSEDRKELAGAGS